MSIETASLRGTTARENIRAPVKNPLWYKGGVIYELHVRSFQDGDGDGTGDFLGLTSRFDYLRDLGVTAVWLLPFYPSPLKDDGYDIADYYGVHSMYGTLADFKTFLSEAHRRGLRVITELVLNHTSDQHPWFQRARRAPAGSKFRDYYVWTDSPEKHEGARIIFKDTELSNWTRDEEAGAFYWHRFFSHQPDLNFDNADVHEEMIKVVDFWFDIGVDGVRLDAVPYLYEREGTSCENLPETHAYLKALRQQVDEKHGDKMLLAEANQWPDDAVRYFGTGKGDECRMAFHFPLMPRLFMSLRMEDRVPMVGILQQTPAIPETAQWALFLRNHDELTLEMVTDEDRDYRHRMYTHLHKARLNLGNGQSQSMVLSARFWARWVSAIFFKAYLQAAGNAAFLPPAESALHMMTEVFLLRKTIYEPGCELSNRPDWVKIPRQGILELMSEENAAAFMTKGEINKAPK